MTLAVTVIRKSDHANLPTLAVIIDGKLHVFAGPLHSLHSEACFHFQAALAEYLTRPAPEPVPEPAPAKPKRRR
jgi:hypothetical protein